MIMVVLIGMALAVVGTVVRTDMQREHEKQLLFVGHQYKAAIARYFAATGHLPQSLEVLLTDDTGGPALRHHLRRLYPDPMTSHPDWVLIRAADGGIAGLFSSSIAATRKHAGFDLVDVSFEKASCYRAWRFEFVPRGRSLAPLGEQLSDCPAG